MLVLKNKLHVVAYEAVTEYEPEYEYDAENACDEVPNTEPVCGPKKKPEHDPVPEPLT